MSTYVFTNGETSYGPSVTAVKFWQNNLCTFLAHLGRCTCITFRPFGDTSCTHSRTKFMREKKSHSNACLNGNTIHYLKNKDISEFSFWQEGLLWQPWLQICSCLNPKIRQGVIIFIWICRSAFVAQVAGKYIIVLSENPGKTSNCSWLKFKLSCLSLSLLKLPFGGTVYPVG